MIKLATMSSVCPDWTLDEVFAGMKRNGYRGFEPRVEWDHACGIELELTAEERRKLKARFADEGLELCCIATGVQMAAEDAAVRSGHVEDLRRYIDLAADLSCPLLRTFGGIWSHDKELKVMVDYMVEGYAQVLDQAREREGDGFARDPRPLEQHIRRQGSLGADKSSQSAGAVGCYAPATRVRAAGGEFRGAEAVRGPHSRARRHIRGWKDDDPAVGARHFRSLRSTAAVECR